MQGSAQFSGSLLMRCAFENNVHRYVPKESKKWVCWMKTCALAKSQVWIKVGQSIWQEMLVILTCVPGEAYVAASRTGTGRKGVFGTCRQQVPNGIHTQQAPARHLQPLQVQWSTSDLVSSNTYMLLTWWHTCLKEEMCLHSTGVSSPRWDISNSLLCSWLGGVLGFALWNHWKGSELIVQEDPSLEEHWVDSNWEDAVLDGPHAFGYLLEMIIHSTLFYDILMISFILGARFVSQGIIPMSSLISWSFFTSLGHIAQQRRAGFLGMMNIVTCR